MVWVGFGGRGEGVDDGFCASSGGESELVGHACSMEVAGIRLCQGN